MSVMKILDWRDGRALWEGEAASVKDAIHAALAAKANLSWANLSRADLSRANLSRANLSGANLWRADLWRANLSGADLSGADLSGADLSRANLSRADLSRANLSGANLSGANLSGADLSGAGGVGAACCTPLLMLLDQPGRIRAYKLVTADGDSPIHHTTVRYTVGQSYEIADANTDTSEHCGAGINVATLDWCLREWRDGWRVLIVEFTAQDIAAIPTATDGKFRLHRCTVVGEKDVAALVAYRAEQGK